MSRLESLRAGRTSYTVKYRDFLRINTKSPEVYVLFFEGQDAKYYAHRIELLLSSISWEPIDCSGKDNVLKLFDLVTRSADHKSANVFFFIDRDLDGPEDHPQDWRMYVTPCYSVENLYVSEAALRKILRHEFGLSEHSDNDDSFTKCLAAFQKAMSDFLDCMAEIHGWIILQRQYEKLNPGSTRANLNSINLAKIIQIELHGAAANYNLSDIERSTNATHSFPREACAVAANAIPVGERALRFRGKFQAHFMRVFLSKLIQDANSQTPNLFAEKKHVPLNISDKNFLSELCQYADTPSCLRDFISRMDNRTASSDQPGGN